MSLLPDQNPEPTDRCAGPAHAARCGWAAKLPEAPAPKVARGARRFDMVVVGAGFTGLACARRLAEMFPSAAIGVLEAERVGTGNSGRNSGFLLDASFYDEASAPVQAARNRLQRAGLRELARVVAEHRIACEWQPWGNLYASLSPEEDRALARLAARYAQFDEPLEDWSAEKMTETTGSPRFLRGIFHPGTVLVQPVKLVRGLAATLPANVEVFENSPVIAVSPRGAGIEIATAESRVSAQKAFLCVNGGAPELGYGRNRLVRVSTFAAMTAPLGHAGEGLAGAPAFGLLPAILGGPTLRKTREGRLLVRQSFAFTPRGRPSKTDYEQFLAQARDTITLRWPELGREAFEFVWSGVMSLTRNAAQLFGEVAPNVYVAAFCNGAGNTSGTMAGTLLADLGAGRDGALLADQMALPRPRWVPPAWLCGPIVRRKIVAADRRLESVHAAARAGEH